MGHNCNVLLLLYFTNRNNRNPNVHLHVLTSVNNLPSECYLMVAWRSCSSIFRRGASTVSGCVQWVETIKRTKSTKFLKERITMWKDRLTITGTHL